MLKPILLILLIIGILAGYFLVIEPRMKPKTEYEKCYEKCITPVIGNSPQECENFCKGKSEIFQH